MTEIRRPQLKEFDRTGVPERVCVRLLSYEERGVLEDMTQTLRKMRSCVFACGAEILTDADVIKVTLVPEDIFARVVPRLILRGFMARDDAGALFSPHLYDRLLRKEERAARKAQAEADRAQWVAEAQELEDAPQGMTPKQIASIINGRKGGRPAWKSMMEAVNDIGVVARQWPPVAQKNGFPDCPPGYDAYVAYFRQQAKGARAAAA